VTPGLDPIIGVNTTSITSARSMDGLNITNPGQKFSFQPFVQSRGGEYFFSPSISALSNTIGKA
jgi:hypothetical protein